MVLRNTRRVVLSVAVLAAVGLMAQQSRPRAASPPAHSAAPARAVAKKTNNYIDAAVCSSCHSEIALTYAKSGMGRSFAKISPETPGDAFPDIPFYHQASESYFAMVQRDGKMIQRRWQISYDGKETNVEEKSVDYYLGSGNHGRTYLHMTPRGGLQQLPLGWYSEMYEIYPERFFGDQKQQLPPGWYQENNGTWAMIPGFDRAETPGSTRPVQYECMFCHNGYPKIPAANEEEGAEAIYQLPLPNGIDCQRCHGPGQLHVETAGKAGATPKEIRASVVNPKRLSPDREMEACLQCHLETTGLRLPHSAPRQDRAPYSYVPGEPLEKFLLAFDREPGRNVRFEGAGAAYNLRKSQCFLKTQGNDDEHRLRCTSCHDPHEMPRGESAASHYNDVCHKCHTEAFTSKIATGTHPANTNCISCHMPKHRTDDATHIIMTDHFIQRNPPTNLLDKKAEHYESPETAYKGAVVPYYPAKLEPTPENMLDVAAAQVRDQTNLREGIPQLASLIAKYKPAKAGYYVYLAEALQNVGDAAHSESYFREALRRSPASTVILLKLGNAQVGWGQWPQAEVTLRGVTVKASKDPVAWALLGQALFQQGKNAEAKAVLDKALSLDADLAEVHNYLGALLVRAGDLAGAEKEFREAVRMQPGNAEWQSNLAGLLASRDAIPEARYLFELSIRLKPQLATARLNYARLLATLNLNAEAEKQAKAAVEADPGIPAAHEMWGFLLTALGDADAAARELNTAVNLQPDFWRAHYELGVALGMKGDADGSTAHLRLAAQGNDPDAQASALRVLQKPGK